MFSERTYLEAGELCLIRFSGEDIPLNIDLNYESISFMIFFSFKYVMLALHDYHLISLRMNMNFNTGICF